MPGAAPTLVFLHEGLGSLSQWRDFPQRLAAVTGSAALVYSRLGYGRSGPLRGKRAVDYMHREALETLPALLDALEIDDPILIGHSDGASIALIHAGGAGRQVAGLILEAPHVVVEDVTVAGIAAARTAWETTDLRQRLARHHADPGGAFWGWNDIWLDPAFRVWNITEYLPAIACPILAIQGEEDEYGTPAQLAAIAERVAGPVETRLLADCRHAPHRDQEAAVLAAMSAFVAARRRTTPNNG